MSARMHRLSPPAPTDYRFAAFVLVIYVGVTTFAAIHHEMWRDELQAWLLARDSPSPLALFRNLKYEGHPALWHLLLTPITRFTGRPEVMQAVHLAIAATSVFLLTCYSPFSRLEKSLLSFSYLLLYEYSIICRNYALSVLFIFVLSHWFRRYRRQFIAVACGVFLLCHTSFHGLLIGMALIAGMIVDLSVSRVDERKEFFASQRFRWGAVIIVLGLATSLAQIIPAADSGFAPEWKTDLDTKRVAEILGLVTRGYLPLPEPFVHFWESHWLEKWSPFREFQGLISCVLLSYGCILLLRHPPALVIYVVGTLGLLTFFYVKFSAGMRHHGFLFVLLLAAQWIARDAGLPNSRSVRDWAVVALKPLFPAILCIHVLGAMIAIWMDYEHPFSTGEAAARFLQEHALAHKPMLGEPDFTTLPVLGYLDKDRAYFPRAQRSGSFVIWNQRRNAIVSNAENLSLATILDAAAMLLGNEVILIVNQELPQTAADGFELHELARFPRAIVADEQLFLYRLGETEHTSRILGNMQTVRGYRVGQP